MSILLGTDVEFVFDVKAQLELLRENQLHFCIAPLVHPSEWSNRLGCNSHCDLESSSSDWIDQIVGCVSQCVGDDIDSVDPTSRKAAETAFTSEISWSQHLSLPTVMIPTPAESSVNYARHVSASLQPSSYQQISVRIPFVDPSSTTNIYSAPAYAVKDGWTLWDKFRTACGHNPRLLVALELTNGVLHDLDSDGVTLDSTVLRWAAEPVSHLIISRDLFVANKANFPVLTKTLQRLVTFFMQHGARIVLGSASNNNEIFKDVLYAEYIQHIHQQLRSSPKEVAELYIRSYRDVLQNPLQPLFDHLESATYETFERDTPKYLGYEQATALAFRTISARNGGIAEPIVVTVVGAGRGPLVAAAIRAAASADVAVRIYAVEKNPNAVVALQNRIIRDGWQEQVTLVQSDMRHWRPTELCDVMISELLGSFGDNELSPECLDGAQKCLKPNGISIPMAYTSFLSPVSCARVWAGARSLGLDGAAPLGHNKALDTTYVVKLHNAHELDQPLPLFRFEHPHYNTDGAAPDNSR